MKYTVIGVLDGRRLEMPVQASSVVVAIKAAEAEGMVVTDVAGSPTIDYVWTDPSVRPVNELAPIPDRSEPPKKPGTDSPVLCAFVGLIIPLIGFLMAIAKCRKDPTGAMACLIGSVVGFVLWGLAFNR